MPVYAVSQLPVDRVTAAYEAVAAGTTAVEFSGTEEFQARPVCERPVELNPLVPPSMCETTYSTGIQNPEETSK